MQMRLETSLRGRIVAAYVGLSLAVCGFFELVAWRNCGATSSTSPTSAARSKPSIDGLEATRRIRAAKGFARLPIVALTANAFPKDINRCLEPGMDGRFCKPLMAKELIDELCRLFLPQSKHSAAAPKKRVSRKKLVPPPGQGASAGKAEQGLAEPTSAVPQDDSQAKP